MNPNLEGDRQCYGPNCRYTARPQSKYCSDACGLKLATKRLYLLLPPAMEEWKSSPSRAEQLNIQQLKCVRAKQVTIRAALAALVDRQKELDFLVERAKHCTLDPNARVTTVPNDKTTMYCVTCGSEIHSKTAIRHMEKCFKKHESRDTFGSYFKGQFGDDGIFCGSFDPRNSMYCRRLRVLCPDHFVEQETSNKDICGCPLVTNVFELTGELCQASKKKCVQHFAWQKIRQADIDSERLKNWTELEKLLKEEQSIEMAIKTRSSVLALLLHKTEKH